MQQAVDSDLQTKPAGLRVPKGKTWVKHGGWIGAVELTWEWLMEGDTWTYEQCVQALSTLAQATQQHRFLNRNANTVTISVGGRGQIRVTFTWQEGEEILLNAENDLGSLANVYEQRALSRPNILNALDRLIQAVQTEGAAAIVPDDWHVARTSQSVEVNIALGTEAASDFPVITFGDVVQFLDAIRTWYDTATTRKAEMWGSVYFEERPVSVGSFQVLTQGYVSAGQQTSSIGNSTDGAMSLPTSSES